MRYKTSFEEVKKYDFNLLKNICDENYRKVEIGSNLLQTKPSQDNEFDLEIEIAQKNGY